MSFNVTYFLDGIDLINQESQEKNRLMLEKSSKSSKNSVKQLAHLPIEKIDIKKYGQEIYQLFESEKFSKLEKIAKELRQNPTLLKSGMYKLDKLYASFLWDNMDELSLK